MAAKKKTFSFDDCIAKILATPAGKEAAMYGPLRDIFINVFGYPASDVDIDTTGDAGRPDVTVVAPTGLKNVGGDDIKLSWIVVEAKDERGIFVDVDSREEIFAEKSKYIGTNTAWFIMVDPTCWVARSVGADNVASDIVVDLTSSLDNETFAHRLVRLGSAVAGVSEALKKFRAGDETLIAYEKLYPPASTASKAVVARHKLSKKRFFNNLRDATEHLQDACRRSLSTRMPKVDEFLKIRNEFGKKYGGNPDSVDFDSKTLLLRARPNGPAEAKQHDSDAIKLRKRFAQEPSIARLSLGSLREFQLRTGAEDERLQELFAIESANLVLARVLLLRFFEDHGFFGAKRYLCNGGVHAFQKMREYFEESYLNLLGHAYRRASAVYASAFDETELDWIFTYDDSDLSSAIEWVLFQLAKYDFRSVQGDILTGIYDRFLDRAKRKELGEFYTPPSIARYMVDRVGLCQGEFVLDPSCGSGTFLIEAYRRVVGDAVERGAAEWTDVVTALSRICGNDINTFSSVIAQIQLLWQVLRFKAEIETHGLPDLQITGRVNSLVIPDQFGRLTKFGELDVTRYAAVVGNPPFVRSERSDQKLDDRTSAEFETGVKGFPGISPKLNSYALFLYRALHSWVRPGVPGENGPGKVAFIVQVSLFDSNEMSALRKLFEVGGRWTIKEIVDLELIYRDIFDADVLPAIFICENRSPVASDMVSIRLASRVCVKPRDDGSLPTFDLVGLPEARIAYADVFTPDGRILTRLTQSRSNIVNKLRGLDCLGSVARPYWVRRARGAGDEAVDSEPSDAHEWTERRMIAGGIAFRGDRPTVKGGLDVYKAENIVAAELQGDPVMRECDVDALSDSSLWRYAHILPDTAFAVAQVAHCPNAVRFNPHKATFTNTATILVPRQDAMAFPFDLLFLSNIYVYFYALAARMGVLRLCRSHIYPTNLAWMPWSNSLLGFGAAIEQMRGDIVRVCTSVIKAQEAVMTSLAALGMQTVKERVRADASARIEFSDGFDVSTYATVTGPVTGRVEQDVYRINLSGDLLDWIEIQPIGLGPGIVKALEMRSGEEFSKSELLNLPIPVTTAELARWDEVAVAHSPSRLAAQMRETLSRLDAIVGTAFGLSSTEIEEIQGDLETDPFLQRIRPRYPGIETRKLGFRKGLDASDRYD